MFGSSEIKKTKNPDLEHPTIDVEVKFRGLGFKKL